MALSFDSRGLLPFGIHDATLQEIDEHFGRFQRTNRRVKLFESLCAYVKEVEQTGWHCQIIIDGCFVMPPVDEPNDIDVVLILPAAWDSLAALKPFEYNVLSKRFTKKAYNIEVYSAPAGSSVEASYLELFSRVRPEWNQRFSWPADVPKGVVRIIP